jgi:hypothetical protein
MVRPSCEEASIDGMSTLANRDERFGASAGETWSASPFAGGGLRAIGGVGATDSEDRTYTETNSTSLLSPFSGGLLDATESESEATYNTLLAELHDEAFEEALQGLIDEAAGRFLNSSNGWAGEVRSDESWSGGGAAGEVEAWTTVWVPRTVSPSLNSTSEARPSASPSRASPA